MARIFHDDNLNYNPVTNASVYLENFRGSGKKLLALKEKSHPMFPSSARRARTSPFNSYRETINEISRLMEDGKKKDLVFVWDIEEITMLTKNYIIEYSARFPYADWDLFNVLNGRIMTNANFRSYDDYTAGNIVNIEDADGDARLAPKYDELRKFYDKISDGFRDYDPIINHDLIRECGMMSSHTLELYHCAGDIQQTFYNRWETARKSLKLVNERAEELNRNHENVVICGDELGCGTGQLLISGSANEICIENVFSTFHASKESVFERIRRRFGENCVLVYVTSQTESAKNLNIPIWEVKSSDSIDALYKAQSETLLR